MTFQIASQVTKTAEHTYAIDFPESWVQGRGAFGGLVLATLLRAIEASEPDAARKTRSLIGDIAAPVLGKGEIVVTVLRRGANQSNIRADLKQSGEVLAFASAILSTPRATAIPDHRPRVEVPKLEEAFVLPHDAPMLPAFAKHFTMSVHQGIPFTGGKDPSVDAWIRLADEPAAIDAPLMIAYLDSYWPAVLGVLSMPRPTATISFTAEILCDLTKLDPKSPLFYRGRCIAEHEGFQLELRELFDAEGNLVAANQQTFAIIK